MSESDGTSNNSDLLTKSDLVVGSNLERGTVERIFSEDV